MATQHRNITDPEVHEPKGITLAPSGTLYASDGSGSGVWKRMSPTNLQGVNSDTLAGRTLVTDGSGGFSLVSTGTFISKSGTGASWNTSANNGFIDGAGGSVSPNTPGHYLIMAYGSGTAQMSSTAQLFVGAAGGNTTVPLAVDGDTGSGAIQFIAYLNALAGISVSVSGAVPGSDRAGLTVTYLGP